MWSGVVSVLCLLAAVTAHGPVVRTTLGDLRGTMMKTVEGKDIYAFRGVPFAKPPVGDLRFKAPVPPSSWEGVRNATTDGPPCPQFLTAFGTPAEDCLTMSVFTPKLPNTKGRRALKPVLVFFHPGGFYFWTGNSKFAGPEYILDQDIVLVASNYRLGPLGYLSTQDDVLQGNYGLKDQVAVLRWVKDNIAAFGGDPNSVTISGYSAGSISVILHMMSPMSHGLFHRAIAMSGSPVRPEFPTPPRELAKLLAELLNCSSESSQQIADCLRAKDPQVFVDGLGSFPEYAFGPTYEPDLGNGVERFLVGDPQVLALTGKFQKVPLLMGHTTLEFAWQSLAVINNKTRADELTNNFETLGPKTFYYESGTARSRQISRELYSFYLKDQPITNASEKGLGELFADAVIIFGQHRGAKLISRKSSKPVYFYKFSFPGRFSYIYNPPDSGKPYGVVHHDDLIYLLYNSVSFPLLTPLDPEWQTMKKMTKMWTDFMKHGNPTPRATPLLNNVTWEPFTEENLKYMDIGEHLEMKTGLYKDRIDLWDRLLPVPDIKDVKKD